MTLRPALLAAVLALAALALPAPAGAVGPDGAARFATGRLWRVERAGVPPSYVLGTFHLPDPRLAALPKRVAALVAHAASLSLELSPEALLSLAPPAPLPAGETLAALLGKPLFGNLVEIAAGYGLTPALLQPMAPWDVSALLAMPPATVALIREGRPGVDGQLAEAALAHGVPVYGLEKAAEQAALLGALPLDQQVAVLAEAVKRHDDLTRLHDWTVESYLAGETLALLDSMVEASPETRDFFAETLIAARNRVMVERMAPRLDSGGALVAVGVAHLPGAGGILDLLARRGYAVTPLAPSPPAR